jgi:hypothetical protein
MVSFFTGRFYHAASVSPDEVPVLLDVPHPGSLAPALGIIGDLSRGPVFSAALLFEYAEIFGEFHAYHDQGEMQCSRIARPYS